MFFIVPAFLYCLLFTNLQPRFLIMIYQNTLDNNANFRNALCKFNLLHYGSLFAIYPLLLFTNFNWILYITMSCIVFPQIYSNGMNNTRPDLKSAYYSKYLFSRFIIIVIIKLSRLILNASLIISSSSNLTMSSDLSASFLYQLKYLPNYSVWPSRHPKTIWIQKSDAKIFVGASL